MNDKSQKIAWHTSVAYTAVACVVLVTLYGCEEPEVATPTPPPVPLTIGGMVAGLSGNSLVLQLNGANDLAVNANGRFRFSKSLTKGSSYAVTVKSSPTTPVRQSCSVSQGNGTLAGIAINNVSITCTTNSYPVGGTVSGLSGKGLHLQLNGTHDVELNRNGDFLFPGVLLSDGSDYSVAITAMPPRQACTIKPINASLDRATIHIVSVKCTKARRP